MESLRKEGFIHEDNLTFEPKFGLVWLKGEIACKGQILITVFKILDVLEGEGARALVQTSRYNYNASVQGYGNIIRRDNAHAHPGHANRFHVHRFDWKSGAELGGSPNCCGPEGWPSLAEFIREVADWYHQHAGELPDAQAVATLGLREGGPTGV